MGIIPSMSSRDIIKKFSKVVTVTLNPTVDRVIEVPGLTPGDHQIGKTVLRSPGGKGVNVSRVLDTMGVSNTMTGFFGEDNVAIFSNTASAHITTDFVVLEGSTRENITIVDTKKNLDTHIRDTGLAVSKAHLEQMRELLHEQSRPGVIITFGGSTPPGVTPQDFADLVTLCIENGASVAVDASGDGLRSIADQNLWLLKPNTIELQEILGKKLDTLDDQLSAARQLTTNIENVLLSLGSQGAYWVTKTQTLRAYADFGDLPVRNTVGCGDTLLGAFIAGVYRGSAREEILTTAVATASASAAHQATAKFDKELAAKLKSKVKVTG